MADTVRTLNYLQSAFSNGQAGGASPQSLRDFLVTDYYSYIKTISSNYTIVAGQDRIILVNASSGSIIINLPAATIGTEVVIKKIDSTINTVTILPANFHTIDSFNKLIIRTQYDTVALVADGSNWYSENSIGHFNTSFVYNEVSSSGILAAGSAPNTIYNNVPFLNSLSWLRSITGFTSSTWTDQSGNSNNATQANGAHQFSLASGVLGGQNVVRSSDTARSMDFPNILPVNADFAISVLFKCSNQSDINVLLSGIVNSGGLLITLDLIGGATPGYGLWANSGGAFTADIASTVSMGDPQTNWCYALFTLSQNPSVHSGGPAYLAGWFVNGQCGGLSPTAFSGIHPSLSSLSIGGPQANFTHGFVGDIAEVLVASSIPSAAEVNAQVAIINATYSLSVPSFTRQVVFVGDSITAGHAATTSGGSWAHLIAANNPNNYYINTGEATATTTDLISILSTKIYRYTSCGVDTVCTVFVGINDIATGSTGVTTYNNIVTLCNDLRSHGTSKIVVVTMLPFTGVETERQNLNNALRAGWAGFADGLADVETIAMGAAGANTNSTWYSGDQVHPNDTGHADLYALIGGVLTSVW